MKLLRSFIAATMLLTLNLPAFAVSNIPNIDGGKRAATMYAKGMTAYQQRDFEQAESYWKRSAKSEHLQSMYSLGLLYEMGVLGQPDTEKAGYWYKKAAQRGAVPAQYSLGKLHFLQGNYEEAKEWLLEAAKADHPNAQFDLATMYRDGLGVTASQEEAAKWYIQAAENGSTPAQFQLVLMYMEGVGVEQDNGKAFMWATRASESGDPNAKYLLGYMYYMGLGTVQSYEMAEIWLTEAVDEGQPKAQTLLNEVENAQKQRLSNR